MSDIERITYENQERRRWADEAEAEDKAASRRARAALLERKRQAVQRETVKVCHMVSGACASAAGIFLAMGLAHRGPQFWAAAAAAAIIGVIFTVWAVEMDEEV